MKKVSVFFPVAMILFVACNDKKLEQLEAEKLTLEQEQARQDSILAELLEGYSLIEGNLARINEKEMHITLDGREGLQSKEDPGPK
ncbi:MAG: hypothetical protein HC842_04715 [Cytophagales bacterium]|nr:hypothetical protein [Cytophagales bacterium]